MPEEFGSVNASGMVNGSGIVNGSGMANESDVGDGFSSDGSGMLYGPAMTFMEGECRCNPNTTGQPLSTCGEFHYWTINSQYLPQFLHTDFGIVINNYRLRRT